MDKVLTIAIPTYNRAQALDNQLRWLSQAIQGYESDCEIIISDNNSNDDTKIVIDKWCSKFPNISLVINRNRCNIGAVKNIAYCINNATGKFVWVISDDDFIKTQALSKIFHFINKVSDLSLIILNFSSRHNKTYELRFKRCFEGEDLHKQASGKELFERCLELSPGGVALTTALVYRTDLARCALRSWSSGLENLAVQLYVTGYCALYGSVRLTHDPCLECIAGTHYWTENIEFFMRLRYAEMPEVYFKLKELGYSSEVCQKLVRRHLREMKGKCLIRGFKECPITTINILKRYLTVFWNVHLCV